MSLINNLGRKLDQRFPRFFDVLGRILAPLEIATKKPVFGCHMCGQCLLHSTGMTCPMECPKNLRNGPCGGVGDDGSCEVDRSKTCTWYKAVNRSVKTPWSHKIYQRNPAVDWSLQGSSAWVNALTGRNHHDERKRPEWQKVEFIEPREKPFYSGSRFERLLRAGEFVVTCEVNPRDSADGTELIEYARTLEGAVDAVHISDNFLAQPHMSGTAAAGMIEQQTNLETILHMTCRDRNRLIMQSDLLGAHAMGVRNVLCLTGDHPSLGDHKEAKSVFDLDSMSFIALVRKMRDEGTFESGRELTVPPKFFIGGAVAITAPPLEFRPHRMAKKIAAGVNFVTSQLVFDMDLLADFVKRATDLGILQNTYLLIGVGALPGPKAAEMINKHTPGVTIPDAIIKRLAGVPPSDRRKEGVKIVVEQIQQMREMPGISGIDLMDMRPDAWFPTPEIVELAGLSSRPVAPPLPENAAA
ncbi:MAG: methylenetetrahydrofolate reductase C-terminal domain-containing protein [Woeseiaceae bacterium]|nr:methylenetetrahydrofolate reductase C-terminal domain-containing protein [Woeseiaceae bacterium]